MLIGVMLWVVWMALELVVIIAMIRWGFETGQWKDIEEPKYRMLIDRPLQGWPEREKGSKNREPAKSAVKEGGG